MAEEGEVEIVGCGVQSVGSPNQSATPETGALVEVTFQKDPYQKNKYLEAEPKALGISQIMLSIFIMSIRFASWGNELLSHIVIGSLSVFGLIAGSVAVAAQNLHLPTLKACLGVQVVMCVMSVICFMDSSAVMIGSRPYSVCWINYDNVTSETIMCQRLMSMYDHAMGVEMLAQAAQVALSATLAAFCCKIIQCCNPQTNVPVIAVNTPQAPQ